MEYSILHFLTRSRLVAALGWLLDASLMIAIVAMASMLLFGCSAMVDTVKVQEPTTMRPAPQPEPTVTTGGIFNDNVSFRPLFEDRRARYVGDTLTISLNEKLQASRNASSNASHKGDTSAAVPLVQGLPGKSFQGMALSANSATTFEGKGGTSADNLFTGTITATVIDVLPNGNLLVSGEKRIGIAQNSERLRFSGVVNPVTIQAGNVVSSTQIADARIDYRGTGYIDEAQTMGWLSRFFMTILPF